MGDNPLALPDLAWGANPLEVSLCGDPSMGMASPRDIPVGDGHGRRIDLSPLLPLSWVFVGCHGGKA